MNAIQKIRHVWAHRGGRDPVLEFFMNAPVDDEPVTPEEEAAVRESRAAYERGEGITLEELKRSLL